MNTAPDTRAIARVGANCGPGATLAARLTPGTWRAAEWTSHAPTTIVTEGPDGRTLIVAECGGSGQYLDDCVADARLMAASKELLAATKETAFYLLSACLLIEDVEARAKALEVVARANAAAAKATGSST